MKLFFHLFLRIPGGLLLACERDDCSMSLFDGRGTFGQCCSSVRLLHPEFVALHFAAVITLYSYDDENENLSTFIDWSKNQSCHLKEVLKIHFERQLVPESNIEEPQKMPVMIDVRFGKHQGTRNCVFLQDSWLSGDNSKWAARFRRAVLRRGLERSQLARRPTTSSTESRFYDKRNMLSSESIRVSGTDYLTISTRR